MKQHLYLLLFPLLLLGCQKPLPEQTADQRTFGIYGNVRSVVTTTEVDGAVVSVDTLFFTRDGMADFEGKSLIKRDTLQRIKYINHGQGYGKGYDAQYYIKFTYDDEGFVTESLMSSWKSDANTSYQYDKRHRVVASHSQDSYESTESVVETQYKYKKFDRNCNWLRRVAQQTTETTDIAAEDDNISKSQHKIIETRTFDYYER